MADSWIALRKVPIAAAIRLELSTRDDRYSDLAGVDGFESGDDDVVDEPSVKFFFLSLPFLKSVSYQPLPERRNDGAVTWRFTASAPQCGHVVGSGSDIFCRRSKWWPQAAHSKA